MSKIYMLVALLLSTMVSAGGRTNWAVPSQIDIERGNGVMIYGVFGNPNGCTIANRFYIKKEHPQYDKIYAAVLAAFTAGKAIRVYAHSCEPVSWYSVASVTYNTLGISGDLNIKN